MEKYLCNLFSDAVHRYLEATGVDSKNVKIAFKSEDITSTRYADYQYNGLIRIFQAIKQKDKSIQLATVASELIKTVTTLDTIGIISTMDLAKNFINITIDNNFLYNCCLLYGGSLVNEGFEPLDPVKRAFAHTETKCSEKKNIVVDYSSPNVAKSLHIGHLRSTIIGESLVRLLKLFGHSVLGLNHIGDWGTQFGMIINYLKKLHNSGSDSETQRSIIEELDNADSARLMEIYRNSKKMFDGEMKDGYIEDKIQDIDVKLFADPKFAEDSRAQTYMLQQGDPFNTTIWKKICAISSKEYNTIYETLNVKNLTERGESFYQPIIPAVIELLDNAGLIKSENGAKIILLDGWTFPLMVVKSDGGYTYDTTDLAALYHRLRVLDTDHVIYITDSGQKTHFDMCFKVAEAMGWLKPSSSEKSTKKLTHIGFGLVCGKDGKKLKTRSGETVKMLDVIDEVIHKSDQIIRDRAQGMKSETPSSEGSESEDKKDTVSFYQGITDDQITSMSRKIGINTLKYFDLCHNYESNYKYDADLMFRFTGDTGVYLMYCFARINGIIEKSTLNVECGDCSDPIKSLFAQSVSDSGLRDKIVFTKETRDLMIHVINLNTHLTDSVDTLDTNKLTKYLFNLCTLFNSFITQKNGKIIGSVTERFGICMCLITSKIIESIFHILSFEEVEHI